MTAKRTRRPVRNAPSRARRRPSPSAPPGPRERLQAIERRKARSRTLRTILTFSLITTLTLILIAAILRRNQPPPRFQFIQTGRIERTVEAQALIVRDERVLVSPTDGRLKPIVAEGVRVAATDRVAMVIRAGMENTLVELENCEQQIAQIQLELVERGQIPAAQAVYTETNGEISAIVRLVRRASSYGSLAGVSQYGSSLDLLIEARESRLQDIDFKDARLDQLASQRGYLTSILGENAGMITAPAPGIVSYRVDGLEERLDQAFLDTLTPDRLRTTLSAATGFRAIALDVAAGAPIARISNGLVQQLVMFVPSARADWFEVDNTHTVRIESEGIVVEDARVTRAESSSGGCLLVLATDRQVARLFDHRVVECSVTLPQQTTEGLLVPITALIEEGGQTFIMLNHSGYARRAAVVVLDTDRTRAIIEPDAENAYKIRASSIVIVNPESVTEGAKVG